MLQFHLMYPEGDAKFNHQMKHWEESWKYDVQWSIFNKLQGVSSGDETRVKCLILLLKKMILEGETKDAKMSSFSSVFQTLIKH